MGYLYYLKNLINGKIYVGKTIESPKIIYRHYIKEEIKENPLLLNEMEKYGKENFLFFIIGEFPNEKLNEWRSFYIKKFNSHCKDGHGYNLSAQYPFIVGVDLAPEVNTE